METYYMILALIRPIIFIAAVVGFTVLMIKIARKNAERRSEAINQLVDLAINSLEEEQLSVSKNNENSQAEVVTKFIQPKRISIGELVIPEDFMFKEEFEVLKYMSITYPEYCNLSLYEPVSSTTISMCEQRMGITFTDELKALYNFTNGMDISYALLGFDFLETIESMHKTGYCDFVEEGDAKDYVIVGSYLGCGDPIVLEKSTGKLYEIDHETGEKSEAYTVKEFLTWAIEFRYEDIVEDEIIEKYLGKDL